IQAASQVRPPPGKFGVEGDLPLSVKDALCLVASKTFGNLEVVPLKPNGPNTTVFVNSGWAVLSGRVVRTGGSSIALTAPNNGERTATVIYVDQNGAIAQARTVSTQGGATALPVLGIPLAEIRWNYDGLYGTDGFAPSDVLDDRPFLCQ